ncbi:MAG: porphobilinogen synthase [Candidatus Pacebacteria bacterium]|nr:porphobilinogen synthase [Candidatus Paceibacterota bacterium]
MSRPGSIVTGAYPMTRPRRLRQAAWSRNLVAETHLTVHDLIWPLFVVEGRQQQQEISSLPGVYRWSLDLLVPQVAKAASLGIPMVAVFPVVDPSLKNPAGSEALNPDNLINRAIRAIRQTVPEIGIMGDVALDPYTSHGHDGLFDEPSGRVLNDATVKVLVEMALGLVKAGCTVLAPSDMMDGRIGAIRQRLEAEGLDQVLILSYAVKYASGFYGPFRTAIGSAGNLGKSGKQTYQMDPANSDEALREVALDLQEGADMVMVKPAMPYLDLVRRVKDQFAVPTLAYQVSGEYAMLKAAGQMGWLDYDRVMMESLLGCKRAGADAILTYAALEIAERLKGN